MNAAVSALAFAVGFVGGALVATGMRKFGMDRGDIIRTILGLAILAVVAHSAATSYAATAELARVARESERVTECQRTQNERFSDAITARGDATTRGNEAQREFLTAVANPAVGSEQTAAAFARYLAALDEIDAARAENPFVIVDCR